jgi:hypothetical protein
MKTQLGYSDPERLGDVMALIQVLALGETTKRSENGLRSSLQRSPKSASSWTSVAQAHPELFRVREQDDGDLDAHRVSLVARAVMPKRADNKRDQLPSDLIGKLLDMTITLHDREIARRERWKSLLPLAVAIITGLFAVAAGVFTAVFKLDEGQKAHVNPPPPAVAPAKTP